MSDVIRAADALGFATTTDASLRPDPEAVRMLPSNAAGLPLALAGGVLSVLVDHVPSAAEFTAFETASGCAVTVTVTTAEVLTAARSRVNVDAGHGRDLPAILADTPQDASAVHLAAGSAPAVRVRGELRPLESWPALSGEDLRAVVQFTTATSDRSDCQHVISWSGSRWRVTQFTSAGHPQVVLRRLPGSVPRLEQLGLPAAAAQTADLPGGLVLVAGRAGSGKSTTLIALLDKINTSRRVWISTIEDPVELTLPSRHAIITQRTLGADVTSVAEAVDTAVAAGAAVVAVAASLGDRDDLTAVLRAAASGALVYLSVPAATVRGALTAVLALVPDSERRSTCAMVAEVFSAGVAQQLLPTRDGAVIPAVEVVWANPALSAVLREDRLTELDSAAAADASGRSISMASAVESLLTSRRVSDAAAAAWRTAHPNPAGLLTGYLDRGHDVDLDELDDQDAVAQPARAAQPTPARRGQLTSGHARTRSRPPNVPAHREAGPR